MRIQRPVRFDISLGGYRQFIPLIAGGHLQTNNPTVMPPFYHRLVNSLLDYGCQFWREDLQNGFFLKLLWLNLQLFRTGGAVVIITAITVHFQ